MNEAGVEVGRGSGSKERRKIYLEKTQISLMSKRCYVEDKTDCRKTLLAKKRKNALSVS